MDDFARILSIEDEETVRLSIVGYLEDSGFEMLEAQNGRIGLEVFQEEKPDLVLCDLRMPELDGLSVLAKVRELSPETPFIIVSGTGDMHDAVEALKLGAWDFVTKPIQDMEILEHAVTKALDRARLTRENHEFREDLIATNLRLKDSLHRLEEDETAARRVQTQLLPEPLLKHDQYEFSHFLKPSAFLSGDFVDYFQIDETHWGFYIADVSGHGASSAFVTVLLKSMMTHFLDQYRQSLNDTLLHPDQILKQVSEAIVQQDLGKYLTMIYAVLDETTGTMTYSNGGHYPRPVLYDGTAAHFLEEHGMPVGLFKEADYSATTVELPPSFLMVMFSDGIFEVLPKLSMKEQKEHIISLVDSMDIGLEDITESLGLDDIDDPPDDIAGLIIKRGV